MTESEAIEYVKNCGETDGPESEQEAREIFKALYGREPDAEDKRAGVWNLCCAAVP